MSDLFCQTPDSTVYRLVDDELVLIQLDTGYIYYFNAGAKSLLDFFRAPKRLTSFWDVSGLDDERADDRKYLAEFCDFLIQNKILKTATVAVETSDDTKVTYAKPVFLRKAEKTLDEVSFLSP